MSLHRLLAPLAAIVIVIFAAMPASAVPLNVNITGYYNATFVIDSNPIPDDVINDVFWLTPVNITSNGTTKSGDVAIGSEGKAAGYLEIWEDEGFGLQRVFYGSGKESLFTGPLSAPYIKTGIFSLITIPEVTPAFTSGVASSSAPLTSLVTITSVVPLPAALPMLAVGLAGLGLMARKRRAARA